MTINATIDWGDGSTTPGTVDGLDGVFRVNGTHTYTQKSGYLVVTTITDADGTTVTTRDHPAGVTAGDLTAGEAATLIVGSFSGGGQATIDWGDGSSSNGLVMTDANGNSTVKGQHSYAAAGGYTVTVTVGNSGWTGPLIGKSNVSVAPGSEFGIDGSEPVTVGSPTQDGVPLAIYTDPAFQSSSALVDWGDGSAVVTVAVSHVAQLAEILANHVYTTAGMYAVKTLVYAGGGLVGATVSVIESDGPKSVDGPAVVPGNSEYTYFFSVPPMGADHLSGWSINDSTVGKKWSIAPVRQAGGVVGFDVTAQFANTPAQGDLRLEYTPTGQAKAIEVDFPVTVVQVIVKNTPTSFVVNESFKDKNANGKGYKGDRPIVNVPLTIDPPAPVQQGTVQSITSSPNGPILTWQAEVALVGPGPNKDEGVKDIKVGFHQAAIVVAMRSVFGKSFVTSSLAGNRYLDVAAGRETLDRPWYFLLLNPPNPKDPPTYLLGSLVGTNATVVGVSDSPASSAVTVYSNNSKVADHIEWQWDFALSVAAATTQQGYDGYLFREAEAVWEWNASGAIAQTGKDAQGNIMTAWTPDAAAGVTVPPRGWNVDFTRPVPLLTNGDLFNQVLRKQTYTTK